MLSGIAFAQLQQLLDVIPVEEDRADEILLLGLLGAEAAHEIADGPRQLFLELVGQGPDVVRRTDHDRLHLAEPLPILRL